MSNTVTKDSLADVWQRFIDGEEDDFTLLGLYGGTDSNELNECISRHIASLVEKANQDFLIPQASSPVNYLVRIIGSRKDLSKSNLKYILLNAIQPKVIDHTLSNESSPAEIILDPVFIERVKTEFKTDSSVARSYHHTLSIKTNFFKEEITNRLDEEFKNLSLEWKIKILGIELHCSECFDILDRDYLTW